MTLMEGNRNGRTGPRLQRLQCGQTHRNGSTVHLWLQTLYSQTAGCRRQAKELPFLRYAQHQTAAPTEQRCTALAMVSSPKSRTPRTEVWKSNARPLKEQTAPAYPSRTPRLLCPRCALERAAASSLPSRPFLAPADKVALVTTMLWCLQQQSALCKDDEAALSERKWRCQRLKQLR